MIFLLRVPWIDRETMIKKIDRLHKENMILQHKIEEITRKDSDDVKENEANDASRTHQVCYNYMIRMLS